MRVSQEDNTVPGTRLKIDSSPAPPPVYPAHDFNAWDSEISVAEF